MTTRYRPYPAYKDSGVEWLGKVPEGWEVRRLRQLIAEPMAYGANESADDETPGNPRYIRITDIDEKGSLREETFRSLPDAIASQYILQDGDILLARSGATVGKSFRYQQSWGRSCYAGYLIRVRPNVKQLSPEFLDHAFQSHSYWQYISIEQIQATIQNVSAEKYGEFSLPLPAIREQKAITTHLDCETARIDALVEKKGRFLELLREKRQALITHAVTKGLDATVPLKDSGVEWLGQVPEHWAVKKLQYVCRVQTGGKDTVNAEDDGEYPFFVRSQTVERIHSYSADCEAVLTAGDGVGVGKVFHYYKGKFDYHQRVYMLNGFSGIGGKFLFHYLQSNFHKVALDGSAKSTVDSLRMPVFLNFEITIPSFEEQDAIIRFIDRETARIDSLIEKTQRSIELLKERRSALITAAVTGQIDLREAA